MALLPELRTALPPTARTTAACDGCVLLDEAAGEQAGSQHGEADDRRGSVVRCTAGDAFSCPPGDTLPQAVDMWGAGGALGGCGGWRCLLRAVSGAAARGGTRLMAQHPLYDAQVHARATCAAQHHSLACRHHHGACGARRRAARTARRRRRRSARGSRRSWLRRPSLSVARARARP
jgi:hypothetical protein